MTNSTGTTYGVKVMEAAEPRNLEFADDIWFYVALFEFLFLLYFVGYNVYQRFRHWRTNSRKKEIILDHTAEVQRMLTNEGTHV